VAFAWAAAARPQYHKLPNTSAAVGSGRKRLRGGLRRGLMDMAEPASQQ